MVVGELAIVASRSGVGAKVEANMLSFRSGFTRGGIGIGARVMRSCLSVSAMRRGRRCSTTVARNGEGCPQREKGVGRPSCDAMEGERLSAGGRLAQ